MATSDNTAAQPQPTAQQPQGKICYGDCFRCSYQQAWMCASMHSRLTMRTAEELMEAVGTLTQEIIDLRNQMTDLQSKFDTGDLINPMEDNAEVIDDYEEYVILPTDPPKRIRKR